MTDWPIRQQPSIDAAFGDAISGSEDARLAAIAALTNVEDDGRERAKEVLVGVLDDPSPKLRAHAALALAEIGAQGVVERLIDLVGDGDGRVVQAAVIALGESGAEEAREPCRRALTSRDADVRFQAVLAIARLAGLEAVDDMRQAIKDTDDEVRANVAAALSDLGGEASIELLGELLDDSSSPVRIEAALGLAVHGDPKGSTVLIDALTDNDAAPQAVHALGRLRAEAAREPLRELTARWLARAPLKAAAAAALAALDDPEGLRELERWLCAKRREPRAMAIWSAGEFSVTAVVGSLLRILADTNHTDRDAAARSLGMIGDARAGDALRTASSDPDPDVAAEALQALEALEGKE